ncbi:MAG: FGGY-family carbohydrate kinase [Treponema sp.]|jgi:sugar (pentulose or hexulose) kinase|nr:FGGY-family carbohydrate kinase [Treponema sp.]
MMPGFILSVDIGTSSLKAAFIGRDGFLKAFSRIAYAPRTGMPVLCSDWERAFVLALGELGGGTAPEAICISGNGPTLVPVSSGEAMPPLHWYDGRALPPPGGASSLFLPRAAWLKEKEPEQYEKAEVFFSPHEWLSYRLGAEAVTVLPSKDYEPFYWNQEELRLFGLDGRKFLPFVKTGSVIGRVSAEGGRLGGVLQGTPVVAGGPDFITAIIGLNALKPGSVCDRAGTSEGVNVCIPGRIEAPGMRVLPHAAEGLWNTGAMIPSSGRLFEWYRTLTGQAGRSYGDLLAELIPSPEEARPLSTDFFFRQEPSPAGGVLKISSSELPGRVPLGRAVLEAMGFMVRRGINRLRALGLKVEEMGVSGGQGRNRRWNSLKASLTGVTLLIPEIPDGELAGDAVLAACALGEYTSAAEAASRMIRIRETFAPQKETASLWEERYRAHMEQYENL